MQQEISEMSQKHTSISAEDATIPTTWSPRHGNMKILPGMPATIESLNDAVLRATGQTSVIVEVGTIGSFVPDAGGRAGLPLEFCRPAMRGRGQTAITAIGRRLYTAKVAERQDAIEMNPGTLAAAEWAMCSTEGGGEVEVVSKLELVAPVDATTVMPLLEVALLLAYPDGFPAPEALNLAWVKKLVNALPGQVVALLHTALGLHPPEDSSVVGPISASSTDLHTEGKEDSEGDSEGDSAGAAAETAPASTGDYKAIRAAAAIRAAVPAPLLKVLVHVGKALPEPVDGQLEGGMEGGAAAAAEPLLSYSGQLALATRQREVGKWVAALVPFQRLLPKVVAALVAKNHLSPSPAHLDDVAAFSPGVVSQLHSALLAK